MLGVVHAKWEGRYACVMTKERNAQLSSCCHPGPITFLPTLTIRQGLQQLEAVTSMTEWPKLQGSPGFCAMLSPQPLAPPQHLAVVQQ